MGKAKNGLCDTYCEHGGVCELLAGHSGQHDSRYCKWDDAQSVTRDEADRMLEKKGPIGRASLLAYDIAVPKVVA